MLDDFENDALFYTLDITQRIFQFVRIAILAIVGWAISITMSVSMVIVAVGLMALVILPRRAFRLVFRNFGTSRR